MSTKKPTKNPRGLSIIELLIAVFIFTLIITAATSTFTNTFSVWKKTRQAQIGLENARTALETIGKSIRMSNRLKYDGLGMLSMFNNSQNKCIKYYFNISGGQIVSYKCTPSNNAITDSSYDCTANACDIGSNYGNPEILIASGATVDFDVSQTDTDTSNPKVGKATMSISVGSGAQQKHIQTTVSFRDYKEFFYTPAP